MDNLTDDMIDFILEALLESSFYDGEVFKNKDGETIDVSPYIEEAQNFSDTNIATRGITHVERVYALASSNLRKLGSSIDGVNPRRLTDEGMQAQEGAYNAYQVASSLGLGVPELSNEQKSALILVVAIDALLIKICDKLTLMVLQVEDYLPLLEEFTNLSTRSVPVSMTEIATLTELFEVGEDEPAPTL